MGRPTRVPDARPRGPLWERVQHLPSNPAQVLLHTFTLTIHTSGFRSRHSSGVIFKLQIPSTEKHQKVNLKSKCQGPHTVSQRPTLPKTYQGATRTLYFTVQTRGAGPVLHTRSVETSTPP